MAIGVSLARLSLACRQSMAFPKVSSRGVLASVIAVGLLTIVAKFAGAAKELVVAHRFGAAPELGVYLFAAVFPAFIVNVLSGSLQVALVPRYLALRTSSGRTAASAFAAHIVGMTLLAVVALVLVLTPAFMFALPRLATAFDASEVELSRWVLVWLMPTAVLGGVSAIWTGILNAEGAFRFASTVPLVTPMLTIGALLFVFPGGGIDALILGALAGITIESSLLAVYLRRLGLTLAALPSRVDADLRHVLSQFAPAAAANFLMAGSMLIEQSAAASVSAANVAAYGFGTRLTAVAASIVVTTLSTVLLPYFSGIVAGSGSAGLREKVLPVVNAVLVVTLPAAALFALASGPITSLVFERGSFDSADAVLVSRIQAAHALYIPIYALSMVAVRLVSALSAARALLVGSALNLLASAVLNVWLVPRIGVVGIAWANVGMYGVSAAFLWYVVLRKLSASRQVGS